MAPDPGAASLDLRQAVAVPLLTWLRQKLAGEPGRRPVLALNGPVGAGKSTTARHLLELAPSLGLRLAVASIDDLYFPLAERLERMRGNPFAVSRVPPGSHDIPLLLDRLEEWRAGGRLRLPRFDKRLADGQGDRTTGTEEEADALVLEGWLMGCRPLGEAALATAEGALVDWPLSAAERAWLPRWDRELRAYVPLWQACDGLWLLRPQRWSLPRRWRFQAEARQRRAGGAWLEGKALELLVRSSLHSLPPPLYQDPLLAAPWQPALADGSPANALPAERQEAGRAVAGSAGAGPGFGGTPPGCQGPHDWTAASVAVRPDRGDSAQPCGLRQQGGARPRMEWPERSDTAQQAGRREPGAAENRAAPPCSGQLDDRDSFGKPGSPDLPLIGVTLLTARRSCLPWPQASPSSASSEIG